MSRASFALINLVLIFGATFVGVRAFARRQPDVSNVRGSALIGARIRAWYFSVLDPFERLLVAGGVPPIALTYSQVAAAILTAFAYAAGLIYTAGVLVLFTGTLDILDGRIARRIGGGSRRGAFLDSVIDRYAEFFGYVGLMVFFDAGWRVWAALFALLGGMMVSYARARAEGLGLQCDEVGLLQRPERFVVLGFGSMFSSIATHAFGGNHEVLSVVVAVLALLTNITAVQRIAYASRKLKEAPHA
jgi:CDP-diacylglycerol--glycerol-3-phosphate 3-phosphatidyltransferase